MIPGDGGDFSQGGRRWHHQFHMTPDLPEALIAGRERLYLRWFYRTFGHRPDAISEADIDEYLRTYAQPGAMRAGFAYYRALPQDAADNAEIVARFKLPMPVLAIGGGRRARARRRTGTILAPGRYRMCEGKSSGLAVTGFRRSSRSASLGSC